MKLDMIDSYFFGLEELSLPLLSYSIVISLTDSMDLTENNKNNGRNRIQHTWIIHVCGGVRKSDVTIASDGL